MLRQSLSVRTSVVDPVHFFKDPDPVLKIRFRILSRMTQKNTGSDRIRILILILLRYALMFSKRNTFYGIFLQI